MPVALHMLVGVCVGYTELGGWGQPGLPVITELINKMMIHKSHLIAQSPGCADSGAGWELS